MPVFLIVFLGLFLKRRRFIDESFVATSSRLVFNVTIPALIFMNIALRDLRETFRGPLMGMGLGVLLLSFLLLWLLSGGIRDGATRGSFVQNSFRSNFAILGLALIYNLYGHEGLAPASVLLSAVMPMFNVLSLVVLLHFRGSEGRRPKLLLEVLKNPLVIAALVSVPYSLLGWGLPQFLERAVGYLASLTMPLALLGIGGSMSFRALRQDIGLVFLSSGIKVLGIPLLGTLAAVLLGFRGQDLGILFILWASPTAVVSFIMAKALKSDSELAANVILVSTLMSVMTIGGGVWVLRLLGLI